MINYYHFSFIEIFSNLNRYNWKIKISSFIYLGIHLIGLNHRWSVPIPKTMNLKSNNALLAYHVTYILYFLTEKLVWKIEYRHIVIPINLQIWFKKIKERWVGYVWKFQYILYLNWKRLQSVYLSRYIFWIWNVKWFARLTRCKFEA